MIKSNFFNSSFVSCEILIPVFNNFHEFRCCLFSVLAYSPSNCIIHILDDASTDINLINWLSVLSTQDLRIVIHTSVQNVGFVKNVNRGFKTVLNNFILLNSDTVVTANWISKFKICSMKDFEIAIICPLSNNATILSVPYINSNNLIPDGLSITRFAKLVENSAECFYLRIPVAVGFCMWVRYAAFIQLGFFHEAFQIGYGEECDYSLRAWELGWEVVCCDNVFVYHHGGQSFKSLINIDDVKKNNASLLVARWPFYDDLIRQFCHINPLRIIQERILTALSYVRGDFESHVLFVLHSYYALGGTELHVRALSEFVSEYHRVTVLIPGDVSDLYKDFVCDSNHEWWRIITYSNINIPSNYKISGHVFSLSDKYVEMSFIHLILGGLIRLVHFHHFLGWGTFELPLIAKRLGIKVVVSLHDYYLFCPVFDLLSHMGLPCGRDFVDPFDFVCLACLTKRFSGEFFDGDLSSYLVSRREKVFEILSSVDVIIVPSFFVMNRLLRVYPIDYGSRLILVPHGVPELRQAILPFDSTLLRFGIFANLNRRKGADILLDTISKLRQRFNLEILHFGGVEESYINSLNQLGVKCFGVYSLLDLSNKASGIHLALVPSVYEETFCLTTADLQSLGIPVVSFSVGAMTERILDGVNGFLVYSLTSDALFSGIKECVSYLKKLSNVRSVLSISRPKLLLDNLVEYGVLYESLFTDLGIVLDNFGSLNSDLYKNWLPQLVGNFNCNLNLNLCNSVINSPSFFIQDLDLSSHELTRVVSVVDGSSSSYYCVVDPLLCLSSYEFSYFVFSFIEHSISFSDLSRIIFLYSNVVLFHGVFDNQYLYLLDFYYHYVNASLILTLDDLITDLPDWNLFRYSNYSDFNYRLYKTFEYFDHVIFSNFLIAQAYSSYCSSYSVIPNFLSKKRWLGLVPFSVSNRVRPRVGWSGGMQHRQDLLWLAPVIEALSDQVDWFFLGYCPSEFFPWVHNVFDMVDFIHYPQFLCDLNLDIAIAPLVLNDFNRCKGNLKLLEYGVLGIPVICTDIEPYYGSPARCLPNSPICWIDTLRSYLCNLESVSVLGKELQDWVIKYWLLEDNIYLWFNDLSSFY